VDRVRETGAEYVVTKHGTPVARLVPCREPGRKAFFGSMKGTVTRPPQQWIDEALEAAGVRVAELSPIVAITAGQIRRDALADPLDRLLVATASELEATFLTSDTRILDYAATTGDLRVHDAST
jgi:antitoxin (DNA-binding transcriptional repressor) of toxin-antitoxin stability system